MTDRELLERAAKAAGGKLSEGTGMRRTGPTWDTWEWYGPMGIQMPDGTVSFPLTNDGDALRMAVALDIWIHPGEGREVVEVVGFGSVHEHAGTDRAAATRRAITRAAAALPGDDGGVR